jgi:hypothetical protein
MRRIAGLVLTLIGAFLFVAAVLGLILGDVDLDTSGKVFVAFMYAALSGLFLWPGVALLRRRPPTDRTD